jgi:RNA polymerase sigma factor (sigma-70 family)
MKFTDTEIIIAIKNGQSKDVLLFLYKTVQPQVKSWIIKNKGSEEEAQDIFQDAVIALYKYVIQNKFKEENGVAAFVFTVSKNLWINRVKQKNKFVGDSELNKNIAEENDFLAETINQERAVKIREILSKLGETCKELLTYKIYHQMSMEEISTKMGFNNADTAKTKHYKCKQRLIKLVKENEQLKEFLHA